MGVWVLGCGIYEGGKASFLKEGREGGEGGSVQKHVMSGRWVGS